MPYHRISYDRDTRRDRGPAGDNHDNYEFRNHYYGWGSNPLEPGRIEEAELGQNSSFEETYVGRGPKSYTRNDEKIRDDVCDLLTAHPEIDATDIDVDVVEGVVHLTGSVPMRTMKFMAEDEASLPFGVKDVINEVRVVKPSF